MDNYLLLKIAHSLPAILVLLGLLAHLFMLWKAQRNGDAAVLQMQTDHVSLAAQLLTTVDADSFLSGLGTMQAEVDRSNAGVQRLQLDQAKLTTLRADAAAAEAELQKQAKARRSG